MKIRKVNDRGEHGMWKDLTVNDFKSEWVTTGGLEEFMKTNISGYYLIQNGWVRSKSTYKKGENLITYDGTTWFLNGVEIKDDIKEIP